MPNLKDLKGRINSVKSTQKITTAMKLVAGSKLRRAQMQAEASRPYAERMGQILASLSASGAAFPKLMVGTGKDETHLLIVITSDRGLCGGFNGSIVRETRKQIEQLKHNGKKIKLICVGRKGYDLLKRTHGSCIAAHYTDVGRKRLQFADAQVIADKILKDFGNDQFDVCSVIYNKFQSAMTQIVTVSQLIPFLPPEVKEDGTSGTKPVYIFEPDDEEKILGDMLPRNLAVQVFGSLLESAASEQGARMTAMDNATRNAGDMIKRLTLTYNRTRQAYITKELIEIISGAEAL